MQRVHGGVWKMSREKSSPIRWLLATALIVGNLVVATPASAVACPDGGSSCCFDNVNADIKLFEGTVAGTIPIRVGAELQSLSTSPGWFTVCLRAGPVTGGFIAVRLLRA